MGAAIAGQMFSRRMLGARDGPQSHSFVSSDEDSDGVASRQAKDMGLEIIQA